MPQTKVLSRRATPVAIIRMGNSQSQSSNDEEVVDIATEVLDGSDSFDWADDDKSPTDAVNNLTLCGSCGIPAVSYANWTRCDCVEGWCCKARYCSDECKNRHSDVHKKELRDKRLFSQPERNQMGECPICCLPLSHSLDRSVMMGCCSKLICDGCSYANKKRENELRLKPRCLFCREPIPNSDEEILKNAVERAKMNDPVAMFAMGKIRHHEGDYETAFDYLTKAAGLGVGGAHHALSGMYFKGQGVEKDMTMSIYHAEEAAMLGDPTSRYSLGFYDVRTFKYDRAKKHFIIAAKLGYHDSLKELKKLYADGHATKEDYASALRAYQAAVDATKSPERELANSLSKAQEAAQAAAGRAKWFSSW